MDPFQSGFDSQHRQFTGIWLLLRNESLGGSNPPVWSFLFAFLSHAVVSQPRSGGALENDALAPLSVHGWRLSLEMVKGR